MAGNWDDGSVLHIGGAVRITPDGAFFLDAGARQYDSDGIHRLRGHGAPVDHVTAVTGVPQVETATIAGTIGASGAGNATITVTAAGMTGSPKAISVSVANNDTAAQVAAKVRAALAADTDVAARFAVSGAGAAVILTRLVAAANDATLNVASANGTCTGLTAAPTSANTTAGVAAVTGVTGTGEGLAAAIGSEYIDVDSGEHYYQMAPAATPAWKLVTHA